MANRTKSESYKAVLNFFRNTLGFDRKVIGQLVRYAVDRIAKREITYYLASNRWLDKIGGRKELSNLITEAIRQELRLKSADWIDRQLDCLKAVQNSQDEAKDALAHVRSAVDCIGPFSTGTIKCGSEYSMDRDNYNKLLANLARLEELL